MSPYPLLYLLTSLKLITRRGSLRTWCTAGVSSAGQSSRTSSQPYEGEHQSQLNIYVCQQKTLSLLRSFYSEIQYISCYITIILLSWISSWCSSGTTALTAAETWRITTPLPPSASLWFSSPSELYAVCCWRRDSVSSVTERRQHEYSTRRSILGSRSVFPMK